MGAGPLFLPDTIQFKVQYSSIWSNSKLNSNQVNKPLLAKKKRKGCSGQEKKRTFFVSSRFMCSRVSRTRSRAWRKYRPTPGPVKILHGDGGRWESFAIFQIVDFGLITSRQSRSIDSRLLGTVCPSKKRLTNTWRSEKKIDCHLLAVEKK